MDITFAKDPPVDHELDVSRHAYSVTEYDTTEDMTEAAQRWAAWQQAVGATVPGAVVRLRLRVKNTPGAKHLLQATTDQDVMYSWVCDDLTKLYDVIMETPLAAVPTQKVVRKI
jgi:hypothetical protein